MFRLRALVVVTLAVAWVTADAPGTKAAGKAESAKGLVADHCSECHVVPGYSSQGLPTVEAPSFQAIADDPDTYTETRLRRFLLQPHWPMGQFRLSASDIDNVVAYMKSLRAR